MSHAYLSDGPADAIITIVLAHGAGGPMDTPWMEEMSTKLVDRGLRVVRFEFDYMRQRRSGGKRAPPPRADRLTLEYLAFMNELAPIGSVIIGGKSMGGRVASMIADELFGAGRISGLLCLGYPFHPIGKPEQIRTTHLSDMTTSTLICQGTRDAFGSQEEAARYELSKEIELFWLEDGDHDFKPRKGVSGQTADQHLSSVALRVALWSKKLSQAAA